MANTAKVRYALKGMLQVTPVLADRQKSAMKDAVAEYVRLLEDPKVSAKEVYQYASALQVLGNSLTIHAQGSGKPDSKECDPGELKETIRLMREVGLMAKPRSKQKFQSPAEEPPAEVSTDIEVEVPEDEPEDKPVTTKKTRSRKK